MIENMKVISRKFQCNWLLFDAFVDVVKDCAMVKDLGGNFYENKEIFIMYE